jgi:Ca-activated chloride channel family protein
VSTDQVDGTSGSTGYSSDAGYSSASGGSAAAEADWIIAQPDGDASVFFGTNPFVLVAHDPLSTFAVDVDTASYDIFRRDVGSYGRLPDAANVRLEEYVNYFHYDYPAAAADAAEPFSVSLAAAPSITSNTTVLRVGIQGKLAPAFQKRRANLVYLVDTSGSMSSADKLPLAQYLLSASIGVLDQGDTISIVTYAGDVSVRLPPTDVAAASTIRSAIEGLSAAGSTNGGAGIQLAYEQAEAGFVEGGINHVVLCTDGDFNVGTTSTSELVALIEDKRKTGITLTVLGFGSGNLNDPMMEAVSNAGNGIYGVITSQTHADDYVQNRLLSTLVHIAKDVKIQVELNPEQVYAYRLLGYENRALADQDFRNDVVDAGEIGAGHQVTALYELVLTGGTIPDAQGAPQPLDGAPYAGPREVAIEDMVLVKVRYKHPDATETDPAFEVSQSMAAGEPAATFENSTDDLAWAMAMAAFAEILKQSPYADPSALPTLKSVFEAQASRDSYRAEFLPLFIKAESLLH